MGKPVFCTAMVQVATKQVSGWPRSLLLHPGSEPKVTAQPRKNRGVPGPHQTRELNGSPSSQTGQLAQSL